MKKIKQEGPAGGPDRKEEGLGSKKTQSEKKSEGISTKNGGSFPPARAPREETRTRSNRSSEEKPSLLPHRQKRKTPQREESARTIPKVEIENCISPSI